jgi:hypothetical protein
MAAVSAFGRLAATLATSSKRRQTAKRGHWPAGHRAAP